MHCQGDEPVIPYHPTRRNIRLRFTLLARKQWLTRSRACRSHCSRCKNTAERSGSWALHYPAVRQASLFPIVLAACCLTSSGKLCNYNWEFFTRLLVSHGGTVDIQARRVCARRAWVAHFIGKPEHKTWPYVGRRH